MEKYIEMIVNYIVSDDGSNLQYSNNRGLLTRCSNCYLADGKNRKCTLTGVDIDELDYCSKAKRKVLPDDIKCKDCKYVVRSIGSSLFCLGQKNMVRVEADYSCGYGRLKDNED